jgi:hypothetical protein
MPKEVRKERRRLLVIATASAAACALGVAARSAALAEAAAEAADDAAEEARVWIAKEKMRQRIQRMKLDPLEAAKQEDVERKRMGRNDREAFSLR